MNFLLKAILLYAVSIPITEAICSTVDAIVPPNKE